MVNREQLFSIARADRSTSLGGRVTPFLLRSKNRSPASSQVSWVTASLGRAWVISLIRSASFLVLAPLYAFECMLLLYDCQEYSLRVVQNPRLTSGYESGPLWCGQNWTGYGGRYLRCRVNYEERRESKHTYRNRYIGQSHSPNPATLFWWQEGQKRRRSQEKVNKYSGSQYPHLIRPRPLGGRYADREIESSRGQVLQYQREKQPWGSQFENPSRRSIGSKPRGAANVYFAREILPEALEP
jgi:hypothetical protein